ncbi:MAG: 30S ribosomal protein S4 [Candidatus Zambryskibacteria bacterium RIFOXYD1_FULL_40_13]|nr:MAG: 30S ribosomal protein S4 [Parcubacteria group bacterium GW2011_GWC1_39_12]KKR19666.1 MAG: 30S ribosomal protein S4 [Parcubacteria group bacterium GW2011_GWF1_39_37]KKR35822.1 MAG: 30S ribosomal protein S4 [Parcubacteria group bacterium GW2011_GWC2_40_10]KKR52634.1 MAG: 30S ribosomal protein S4 [Parcubacteria group bacterium GW2011_GWE1_40_20]KKR68897.1 MAG: 30S ribosomal protein S4 [Parcubacteria group bacterium GW2011_GWF2_40_69]KKR82260.1 MAG: 30S ribosomal protein S4 [Parcubacteria 
MIIGPKYKIARRLGAPIFEKTQTQKYALHLERKGKKRGFSKAKSEYGLQMNEKQKARFTYGLSEKQFSNYVKEALTKKTPNTSQTIYEYLELRLDNVLYRLGFSTTRLGSRQIVSHGHVMVNGRKVDTPSRRLILGDKVEITPRSLAKPIFKDLDDKIRNVVVPSWIKFDSAKKVAEIQGKPQMVKTENMFDLNAVIEFYSR